MTTLLDSRPFRILHPENDRQLADYFIEPAVLPALLNPQSAVVAALAGYGKTTVAYAARQVTQHNWLNVELRLDEQDATDFMETLLCRITETMWSYIEANPDKVVALSARAEAAKYFLGRYTSIDLTYQLTCLAEDRPEYALPLQRLIDLPVRELFTSTATAAQRLNVLCDCVQKLGLQSINIWLDLSQEIHTVTEATLEQLRNFFDSLDLMRRRSLHVKCLAPPSLCAYLSELRGVQTLSVATLTLDWSPGQLGELVNRRLQAASQQQASTLANLIDPQAFEGFLTELADGNSPTDWLSLARLVVETVNATRQMPLTASAWLKVRRAFCRERLKIRLDADGRFWRGQKLLPELNQKKRAIYPLVKYLYDNPGFHRTYRLIQHFNTDESTLNTTVSRARKEHLEPQWSDATPTDDVFIYLVTDTKDGGYGLLHTDRSP